MCGDVLQAASQPIGLTPREDLIANNAAFGLTYGSGLSGNLQAQAAFQRAAQRWADVLRDPVTINLNLDYQPLGSGILGQSSSTMLAGGYDTVRNLVAGGVEGKPRELSLLPNLPTSSQLSVRLPSGFALDGTSWLTSANYKALGGAYSGSDGSITFSSNFSWDFDASDGITPGAYDFEGIAVHEIGHNLGFVSEEDYVDSVLHNGQVATDVWPRPLDYFRFLTSDLGSGFDFTTTPRDLVPGGSQSFYHGDGSALMSTGQYYGDGRQASHWKDNLGIGILDPTAAAGELLSISNNDLAALDLIGWDVVPEPATLSLLALGGLAILRRRKAS
ncbi:MAG: NF038122 family metalloprotease [Phycisphaerae bacterium]